MLKADLQKIVNNVAYKNGVSPVIVEDILRSIIEPVMDTIRSADPKNGIFKVAKIPYIGAFHVKRKTMMKYGKVKTESSTNGRTGEEVRDDCSEGCDNTDANKIEGMCPVPGVEVQSLERNDEASML